MDHFIPWSRYQENGLFNLVITDQNCNGNKSDFIAAVEHMDRWLNVGRIRAIGQGGPSRARHRVGVMSTRLKSGKPWMDPFLAATLTDVYIMVPIVNPIAVSGPTVLQSQPSSEKIRPPILKKVGKLSLLHRYMASKATEETHSIHTCVVNV